MARRAGVLREHVDADGDLARPPARVRAVRYDAAALTLTSPRGPLTAAQRRGYERDGFVVVRGVFAPGELAHLHAHYLDVCRDRGRFEMKVCGKLVRDINVADGTLDRSELPLEYSVIKLNTFRGTDGEDPAFCSYMRHAKLLPFVRQFVGSGALLTMNCMYVCKPPGLDDARHGSTRHPLHQDMAYFPLGERDPAGAVGRRDKDAIVCAWTALGPVTRRNGCLELVPGSHWRGVRAHAYPKWGSKNNAAYFAVSDLTDDEFAGRVHAEMSAGDVVFFHPELIHGSGSNKVPLAERDHPEAFRKAIAVHYVRESVARARWAEVPWRKAIPHVYAEMAGRAEMTPELERQMLLSSRDVKRRLQRV